MSKLNKLSIGILAGVLISGVANAECHTFSPTNCEGYDNATVERVYKNAGYDKDRALAGIKFKLDEVAEKLTANSNAKSVKSVKSGKTGSRSLRDSSSRRSSASTRDSSSRRSSVSTRSSASTRSSGSSR